MNDRRENSTVDPDRTEGSMKKMGGDLKEGAGNILGDEKMKREGQASRGRQVSERLGRSQGHGSRDTRL